MTCRDCKQWETCTSCEKSDKPNPYDGDAWANWCEGFDSIHETKKVELNGRVIVQSGYNWHITIWDQKTEKLLLHASCTKEKTEDELRKMLEDFDSFRNDVIGMIVEEVKDESET